MVSRLDNVKLHIGESEENLVKIAQKKLKRALKYFKILKKSLDARDKNNVFWVYSIAFSDEEQEEKPPLEKLENPPKVAVIGSGPAGLFCALRLIEHGVQPIIIERGEAVEDRRKTIDNFFKNRVLNPDSNVSVRRGRGGNFFGRKAQYTDSRRA